MKLHREVSPTERLSKVNDCFLSFDSDPNKNIQRLTALCGEILNANCALYSRLEGADLAIVGRWNAPAELPTIGPSKGLVCTDLIHAGGTSPWVIPDLQKTSYAESDPFVLQFDLRTYLGLPVSGPNGFVGAICALYHYEYQPTEEDKKLLGIIAGAIRVEEERRNAHFALRESEKLFRQFMDNIEEVFWMATPDASKVIYVSPAYERVWGRSREEIYGEPLAFLKSVHPEDRERVRAAAVSLRNRTYDQVYRLIDSEGNIRWIHDRAFPVRNEAGEIYRITGMAMDITSRKQAESTIADQHSKIAAASKMSALGEMAGGIAHEINNPLTILEGMSRMLKRIVAERDFKSDQVTTLTNDMETTVHKIAKIVRGLRMFARDAGSDPFQLSSVQTIVDETLAVCRERFAHHKIDLSVNGVTEDVDIECRPTQISQVLLNLLNNAFDEAESLHEKWVRLDVKPSAENVIISVTDSGRGIPKDIQDKIIQPFFSTKPVGKGTGLGLSISKGLVESHHGTLTLDTECMNTRFVVTLKKRLTEPNKATVV